MDLMSSFIGIFEYEEEEEEYPPVGEKEPPMAELLEKSSEPTAVDLSLWKIVTSKISSLFSK